MTVPRAFALVFALLLVVFAPACAAVAGIFKAGVWVGVVVAVLVVALGLFVFSRVTR